MQASPREYYQEVIQNFHKQEEKACHLHLKHKSLRVLGHALGYYYYMKTK